MFKFQLDCLINLIKNQIDEYDKYINEIFAQKEVVAILSKLKDNLEITLEVFKKYQEVLNEKR